MKSSTARLLLKLAWAPGAPGRVPRLRTGLGNRPGLAGERSRGRPPIYETGAGVPRYTSQDATVSEAGKATQTSGEGRIPRFAVLEAEPRRRGGSFLASLSVHLAAAAVLALMGQMVVSRAVLERGGVVWLAPAAPERVAAARPPAARVARPASEFRAPQARPQRPSRVEGLEAPPMVAAAKREPAPMVALPAPPVPAPAASTPPGAAFPEIRAAAEPQLAVRRVESSGFDHAGKITLPEGRSHGAVGASGFDEAAAGVVRRPGNTAGVQVGGFEAAEPSSSRGAAEGQVRKTEFDEAPVRAEGAAQPPRRAAARQPVEILFKSKPEYTAEGRRRRIEGEVLLEVVFEVTGEIRVLRVLRGLGYGLDEAAVEAARKIRFKPAMEERKPVAERAVLRVVFQMAG